MQRLYTKKKIARCVPAARHRECGEGLWLQWKAALQTHNFRDADPQHVIPSNAKNNHGMSLKHHGPGMQIRLTTTDSCVLHGNTVLSVAPEAVNLNQEM